MTVGEETNFCKACVKAKHTHDNIPKECTGDCKTEYGALIYSDVWGPAKVQTKGGMKWHITFTDGYNQQTHTYLMASKVQALERYKVYNVWVFTQHTKKSKKFQTDNGSEFISTNFKNYLQHKGTKY